MPRLLALLGGLVLIAVALFDGFNTVVLPRRVRHGPRLSHRFYRITWNLFTAAGRRIKDGRRREEFLSIYGPLSLISLLVCWAMAIIAGFALLHWSVHLSIAGQPARFFDALYLSASSMLMIGSIEPLNTASKWLSTLEAGIGFGTLGIVVGYLPVLYQSYARRELRISLLDARAGSPPSAAELLVRQSSNPDNVRRQLVDWEEWAAEFLEEHLSYPMLAYFRSQHQNQSWLAAITAMLDSSAVVLLCSDDELNRQAYFTFAICRHALVDLSTTFNAEPEEPREERVSAQMLSGLIRRLREAHSCLLVEHLSVDSLCALRRQYESYAYSLSLHFLAALPEWMPRTGREDNWLATSWRHPGGGFAVSDPFVETKRTSKQP